MPKVFQHRLRGWDFAPERWGSQGRAMSRRGTVSALGAGSPLWGQVKDTEKGQEPRVMVQVGEDQV